MVAQHQLDFYDEPNEATSRRETAWGRDPETFPGLAGRSRRQGPFETGAVDIKAADFSAAAHVSAEYLMTWFLGASAQQIRMSIEERHLILLQAQLHALRLQQAGLRRSGLPVDARCNRLIRRLNRQIQWLLMGVSANDVAEFSGQDPEADLPDTQPPITRPPLASMPRSAASNG